MVGGFLSTQSYVFTHLQACHIIQQMDLEEFLV